MVQNEDVLKFCIYPWLALLRYDIHITWLDGIAIEVR